MSIIHHIADPWTHALAWSLLHSIWQVLIIAGLWKFSMWLAHNTPANTRYHISLLALLAVPVTFAITFIQQYGIYKEAERVVLFEFENSAWLNMQKDSSFFVIEKNYPEILQNFDNYTSHIFLVYIMGAALISVWFIVSYSKLFNLRKKNITELPNEWEDLVNNARQKAGIGDSIRVYLSSIISIPAVIGFFKPLVLFPLAIVGSISIHEVETILLHEFYHIRKKDHYINALQYLLEILFFYHPFTWWISSSLRREREKRVDEWVVTQTSEPLLYAKALLTLEENRKMQPQAVMAATNSKNSLLIRIKNFMHMKTSKFNSAQKMAATLVIAGAILSLAWLQPSHMYYYINDYAASGEGPVWVETPTNTLQDQPINQQAPPTGNEPKKIYLENGKSLSWDELSDKDKKEIKKAMEEVRLAMQEVNREVFEKLNSEEFRNEMLKVGEEVRKAMEITNTEIIAQVNSDEFRREMEKVREEVRKAMEEVNRELNSEEFRREMQQAQQEIRRAMEEVDRELNSEEFRQEMKNASEEVRRAMQEVQRELNSEEFREEMRKAQEEIRRAMQEVDRELNSEEFRQEMQQAGEAMRIAFEQMEQVDWKEFGESLNQILQEVGTSIDDIAPIIQEGLKNINFEEMFRSFEYNYEETPEEEMIEEER
jgi:bla regulator protein blaR1